MARDVLETVLRVRQIAADEAKRLLAAGLREEEAARRRVAATEDLVNLETEIAADLSAGDGAVEAYAAWLRHGLAQQESARAAHERSTTKVTLARAGMVVARAAAEAAANMLARRLATQQAAAAKRAQAGE